MVYPYSCEYCVVEFDVVKHHSLSSKKEKCPHCKRTAQRLYTPAYFTGTKVEDAEYNYGLGLVTKSKRHRNDEAKARGLIEVGNDSKPKDSRKHFEQIRERKRQKIYEDVG